MEILCLFLSIFNAVRHTGYCNVFTRLRVRISAAADFNNLPALLLPGHRTFAGRGSPVDIAPASAAAPERRRCGDIIGEFGVVLCHSGRSQAQALLTQMNADLVAAYILNSTAQSTSVVPVSAHI